MHGISKSGVRRTSRTINLQAKLSLTCTILVYVYRDGIPNRAGRLSAPQSSPTVWIDLEYLVGLTENWLRNENARGKHGLFRGMLAARLAAGAVGAVP